MNYLIEYDQKVMTNEILAGEELKSTLRKLMDDMVNPRYDFDEKPGNMRIDFIETFCKHTKSPFNGQPFILELWEKAIIQTAYGFKIAETGLRRFNEVILLIARKNGKTTFIAGIDLAEFFLSKGGVDIVCASNKSEQANIPFAEINNMREYSFKKLKTSESNLRNCTMRNEVKRIYSSSILRKQRTRLRNYLHKVETKMVITLKWVVLMKCMR